MPLCMQNKGFDHAVPRQSEACRVLDARTDKAGYIATFIPSTTLTQITAQRLFQQQTCLPFLTSETSNFDKTP